MQSSHLTQWVTAKLILWQKGLEHRSGSQFIVCNYNMTQESRTSTWSYHSLSILPSKVPRECSRTLRTSRREATPLTWCQALCLKLSISITKLLRIFRCNLLLSSNCHRLPEKTLRLTHPQSTPNYFRGYFKNVCPWSSANYLPISRATWRSTVQGHEVHVHFLKFHLTYLYH